MEKLKKLSILWMSVIAVAFTACSENDDPSPEFDNWQERNAAFFTDIYSQATANEDGNWKIIKNWAVDESKAQAPEDHIVVHVLEEGTGSGSPLFTDSVRIHYRGSFMPTDSYPEGLIFDTTWTGEFSRATAKAITMSMKSSVAGFSTALQHMHIGDRWRIYIPYKLGYGKTAYTDSNGGTPIPGYSTLVFEVVLVAYGRVGVPLPKVNISKQTIWIEQ